MRDPGADGKVVLTGEAVLTCGAAAEVDLASSLPVSVDLFCAEAHAKSSPPSGFQALRVCSILITT